MKDSADRLGRSCATVVQRACSSRRFKNPHFETDFTYSLFRKACNSVLVMLTDTILIWSMCGEPRKVPHTDVDK